MSLEAESVLVAERRWTQAHLDMDLETIESLLSDRYRHYNPDGTVSGKAELLASYGSGDRYWEVAKSSDHAVEVLGDVAILTGRWRGVGINAGEHFDYTARFVCLYVLEDGVWHLLLDVTMQPEENRG